MEGGTDTRMERRLDALSEQLDRIEAKVDHLTPMAQTMETHVHNVERAANRIPVLGRLLRSEDTGGRGDVAALLPP